MSFSNTVWFKWTPSSSGTVVISTRNSSIDTLLAVYTGNAVNSLTLVTPVGLAVNPSDDYYSNGGNGSGTYLGAAGLNSSFTVITVTSGVEYQIQIAGYSGAQGAVTLNIQQRPTMTLSVIANAAEPSTNGTFRVTLSNTIVDTLWYNVTMSGTATNGTDYSTMTTGPTGSISPNTLTSNFTLTVTDDVTLESSETSIATIQTGAFVGSPTAAPSSTTMTISDDEVIYVNPAAGGANNGNSWANGFTDLQSAISYATSGNKIWVKTGTYKPTSGVDRSISFNLKAGVTIYGGFAGNENNLVNRNYATNRTVLSGDIGNGGDDTDNTYNVVNANAGGAIDGFIIVKGYANGGLYTAGGGLYVTGSTNVSVENCIFDQNYAITGGGAMAVYSLATATVRGCLFATNSADGFGGGAFICENTATINVYSTTFANNSSGRGRCVETYGGGQVNFQNCILRDGGTSSSTEIFLDTGGLANFSYCNVQGSNGSGASWVAANGTDLGNNLDSDPRFLNENNPRGTDAVYGTTDDGMRLLVGSPCVDTGTNNNQPTRDMLYGTRTLGASIDMGAYEGKLPTVQFAAISSSGSESSTPATITVSLNGASDLTTSVNYSTSDVTAAAGSDYTSTSGSVSFSPGVVSQTFNVVILPDQIDENNETLQIGLSSPTNGKIGATSTHTFTINDDDVAGFTVTLTGGVGILTTTEGGGTATFTIVLNSQPTGNVSTLVTAGVTTEGQVKTTGAYGDTVLVSFNSGNWSTPQTVTVQGVEDSLDDGDVTYTVSTGSATSGDTFYSGINPADVSVKNTDNDTAGVTMPASFASVTEAAGASHTKTFTFTLNSQPYAPVTFNLSSSDTTEARVRAGFESIVLDSTNWSTGVTISIDAEDDAVDDGNIGFNINIAKSSSAGDPAYNNLGGWAVSSSCIDDDTKGVTVTQSAGTTDVTEGGANDSYTVVLNSQPTATVTVSVSGDSQVNADTDANTSGVQSTLTFTTSNWNQAQTVTVSAIDDHTIEASPHSGTITTSVAGGDYAGFAVGNITVNVTDNDVAGLVISPTTDINNRLITNEAGGTATFSVTIATQPAVGKTVTVDFVSDDLTEGAPYLTPSVLASTSTTGASETFQFAGGTDLSKVKIGYEVAITGSGANTGITTLVTAVNDGADTLTVAADLADEAGAETVSITSVMTLTSLTTTGATKIIQFGGGTDLSDVEVGEKVLIGGGGNNDELTTSVVAVNDAGDNITVSSIVLDEVGETVKFWPYKTLVFGNGDWNVAQNVVVVGIDDADIDNAVNYLITSSIDISGGLRDLNYDGLTTSPAYDVYMKNQDDDVPGVRITQTGGSTDVAEDGSVATDTYTIRLNTSPGAGKTVNVAISSGTQVTVDKTNVFFTDSTWNVAQTVTVTVVDDLYAEGSPHFGTISHTATSDAAAYNNIAINSITVSVTDDDSAGYNVIPSSGLITNEAGGTATFIVSLTSKPTANVVLDVSSSDTTEGTVPANITFTTVNWFVPHSVTITGVNDNVDDGDVPYTIVLSPNGASADVNYCNLDPIDVTATNQDNDAAGVTLSKIACDVDEDGTTDSYTIALNTKPPPGTTVTIVVTADSQVTVDGSPSVTLTFDPSLDAPNPNAWDTVYTVSVSAVDDDIVEGGHLGTIRQSASGGGYSDVSISNVTVSIDDNDSAGVTVGGISGHTTEGHGTATFTMALDSQPTSNVTVLLTSNDTSEGTVTSRLLFTPANFDQAQTVHIIGVDDDVDDDDQTYAISMEFFSVDTNYNSFSVPDVSVINDDDDIAGMNVVVISDITNEAGTEVAVFSVSLNSEPTDAVATEISSNNANEGIVTAATSTLNFDSGNWNVLQYVQVIGVDDDVDDGDVAYQVDVDPSSAADTIYNALASEHVDLTNEDDDAIGLTLSTLAVNTTEGSAVFRLSVRLASKPSADVTVTLDNVTFDNADGTEGDLDTATLTFTTGNWNVDQQVQVIPVNDFFVDGDQAYNIDFSCAGGGYDAVAAHVAVINKDNDTAAFQVTVAAAETTEDSSVTKDIIIVLTSKPDGDVTITFTGLDPTEGSLSSASAAFNSLLGTLTFDHNSDGGPTSWNTPQTITVTGVDDYLDDGNITYTLTLTPSSVADATYNALAAQPVAVTNDDDDTDGVTIDEMGGVDVAEGGATDQYTIALNAQPSQMVTIDINCDGQASVEGGQTETLTFDPAVDVLDVPNTNAWNLTRTITVAAVVDQINEVDIHNSTITHTVNNYPGVTASNVTVHITDDNPPSVAGSLALTVNHRGDSGNLISNVELTATDVEMFAAGTTDNLTFTILLESSQGVLKLGPTTLHEDDTFTLGDINSNLLTYDHNITSSGSTDGFAVKVEDSAGNESSLAVFHITINGNQAPNITFHDGDLNYTERDNPTAVDSAPTVTDGDTADFNGSFLQVSIPVNADPDDVFVVNDNGAVGIGVVGNTVNYNGSPIATKSGTQPLTVTFTASVNAATVNALLASIQFRNDSYNPSGLQRTVRMQMTDDTVTAGNQCEKFINFTAVDNKPEIAFGDPSALNFNEDNLAIQIDSSPTSDDLDSANYDGGALEVGFSSGFEVGDELTIHNSGTIGIGRSGGNVTYNNGVIGTWSGGIGGAALIVSFNTTVVTDPVVVALIQSLRYQHTTDSPTSTPRAVYVTLTDGTLTTSDPISKIINVIPAVDVPIITLSVLDVPFAENQSDTVLDAGATVQDDDTVDFNGAQLLIDFTINDDSTDALVILSSGFGIGQIGVVGTTVYYENSVIGTFSGNGPLAVTFTQSTSNEALTELIRSIAYRNLSENPTALQRTVAMHILEADGVTDGNIVTLTVTVDPEEDAPEISFAQLGKTYTENDPAMIIDNGTLVSDLDSTNFNGGSLTVSFTAGDEAGDEFIIRNVGNAGIGINGTTVTYLANPIGTWSGTNPLVVTFSTSNATVAAVNALMQNIQYRHTTEDPTPLQPRTVRFVLVDDTNTASDPIEKDIDVIEVNDAPTISGVFICAPNVATTFTLNVADDGDYAITLQQIGGDPIKGSVDNLVTNVASSATEATFDFTPNTNASGTTTFVLRATDSRSLDSLDTTITILICGSDSPNRLRIVSDPPFEVEAGSTLNYDIKLDGSEQGDFNTDGGSPDQWPTYTLVGTLPNNGVDPEDQVTSPGFQRAANGYDAALGLIIGANITGYLDLGVVVVDPFNSTASYQSLLIKVVPAGTLTN